MTREQFQHTAFGAGCKASYKGKTFLIATVDFEEDLIGLADYYEGDDEYIKWVRCESITLISQ